ncbi:MAG: cytochrome C oxidase Cbb3 [Saprospiraceae bacterium]|nr:cytochrome C oxidase Cbb3 [Saprospiraceae bacterium]
MYKYILESVSQINWMGIAPLVIFFSFFTIMLIKVLREDKSHVSKMAQMPLDKNS